MKTISNWTVEDYAAHYVETLKKQPNGWGQYISETFGQSHVILFKATKLFGAEKTDAAISKLLYAQDKKEA